MFSFVDANQNDFILFNLNNHTNLIGRVVARPHSTSSNLLVNLYRRLPETVHLIGSLSTFGLSEVTHTDEQIVIESTDITYYCFVFDIQTHIRDKVHIQGMTNAFIINTGIRSKLRV